MFGILLLSHFNSIYWFTYIVIYDGKVQYRPCLILNGGINDDCILDMTLLVTLEVTPIELFRAPT